MSNKTEGWKHRLTNGRRTTKANVWSARSQHILCYLASFLFVCAHVL